MIHFARLGLQHLQEGQLVGHRSHLHVQERQLDAQTWTPEGKHDAKGPRCLGASSAELRRASSTPTSSALLHGTHLTTREPRASCSLSVEDHIPGCDSLLILHHLITVHNAHLALSHLAALLPPVSIDRNNP
jgi:hypothetical protein